MKGESEIPAIETVGVTRSFKATRALAGVDLSVSRGSVFALLGPNGAGKTTLVRILATLLQPDGGISRVLGYDTVHHADEVRRRVSLTGQFASVDEDLTGRENLFLLARLHGYSRSDAGRRTGELLTAFDLADAGKRMVKTYSGGMRRRLDIAAGIVVTPDVMFLDEPTTGLDPRSRNEVWAIVRALVAGGTTVLLTTQYMEEADQLADRIAVIDKGRIIAEGTSDQLKERVGTGVLHIRIRDARNRAAAVALLRQHNDLADGLGTDQAMIAVRVDGAESGAALLARLRSENIGIDTFSFGRPSLDEVFLALTGHSAETVADEAEATEDAS